MQFFDEQVQRNPGQIALVFAEREWSYQQLAAEVDRLALDLQGRGIGPETLVGVFMDRSVDMIVVLLAILKAGGAYVPLDPAYPAERITLVAEDSRAFLIITTSRLRHRLLGVATPVLALAEGATFAVDRKPELVSSPARGANLAYVIYTSGSTGRPKGVMVEHRNVLSFFSAMDRLLGTEPGVWLAVTSISFDISVLELIWTLTRGFKVVLHGDEGTQTIAGELISHGVTHFQSTPSLAQMLVADPRSLAALAPLKKLLLGGEALPTSLLRTLRRVVRGEIYNMYGPTETTIWSTAYRTGEGDDLRTTVPIGQPLANTHVYVLDSKLQRVSGSEPGELFLGGAGVTRGYWERTELTAERFLTDPFAGQGRMYRTGDIARHLTDGKLEFLGRTDSQIKLRGHRIELGEIEATLERIPSVRQAVVATRENRHGDRRLVAYVVLVAGQSVTPESLRRSLGVQLPEYMVPAQFVFLESLPLTPNGKIDRASLPDVPIASTRPEQTIAPEEGACSRIEFIIARVWAEALGVQQVGMEENVFDLGATSLMMPEVQLELQRVLVRDISLVDLFEYHTVSALAAHLEGDQSVPQATTRANRGRRLRHREGQP
jgi:amino acid adenylation domain-containing protein